MSWTNNNRAHACLWFFEKWHKKQADSKFTLSGEWTTDFLIGAAAGESPDMRNEKAKTHSIMLDGAFKSLYGASYENGADYNSATSSMLTILSDSTKKMKDLGDIVDSAYKFYGE